MKDEKMIGMSAFRMKVFFSLMNLCLPFFLSGQVWENLYHFGGIGEESILCIEPVSNGLIMGGSFSGALSVEGNALNAEGGRDICFWKYSVTGELEWIHQVGSQENDVLTGIQEGEDGKVFAYGEFWLSALFDSTTVILENGSKGIFIAAYEQEGKLDWVQQISGKGLKSASAILLHESGNLVSIGYFSDTIIIADTLLIAKGNQDMFSVMWTQGGTFIHANSYGGTGNCQATCAAVGENGDLLIGGEFDGSVVFGNDTLNANTGDKDIFLISQTPNGIINWAQKAGGLLDDHLLDMVIDNKGYIWLTGDFSGVLNPGNDALKLSSMGFPTDAFLLRYTNTGIPDFSLRLGGASYDYATSITVQQEVVFVAGFFKGTMTIGGQSISSLNEKLNGFLAVLDNEGQLMELTLAASQELAFFSVLGDNKEEGVYAGGTFLGSLELEGMATINSNGGTDGFVAKVSPMLTDLREFTNKNVPSSYPNPFSDFLYVELSKEMKLVQLADMKGMIVHSFYSSGRIATKAMPAGVYFLHFTSIDGRVYTEKLIKL